MVEEHHTNYALDETVDLCRQCHKRVHSNEADPLYPDDIENSPHRNGNMRPKINRGEKLRPEVKEYAEKNGYRMSQAWSELAKIGLKSEGYDYDEGQ